MEIRTLATSKYRECPIYIRNFGNIFEYLFVFDGQVYQGHIVVTKSPLQWLLGQDYTKDQLKKTTAYILKMAETTIDTVVELQSKKA